MESEEKTRGSESIHAQPSSGARAAWQPIPLSQGIEGETNLQQFLSPSPSPSPGPGRQNEAAQTVQGETVANSASFHLPLSQIATLNAQQQSGPSQQAGQRSTKQESARSSRVSARGNSQRRRHSTQGRSRSARDHLHLHLHETSHGRQTPVVKAGLGNTALGSPHDPRELHDMSSIDPVWRRREESKARAQRLNALLGASQADRPIVDEKQYEQSIMKQHARRLKIKSFERRFTAERLKRAGVVPADGHHDLQTPSMVNTRDFSETFMSVVSGKPPFCSYGNGNTAPASGGLTYGNYLLSHNVSPERRPNHPGQRQSFDEARRAKDQKQKQNAQTLKRLLAAGEVLPTSELPTRPNTAAKLRSEYEAHGRRSIEEPPVSSRAPPPPPPATNPNVNLAASLSQQAQFGNQRNVAAHFDPAGGSFSPSSDPVPVKPVASMERVLAWQLNNEVGGEARRSGRKQGYAEADLSNSLASTSARTMSVVPQPEPHPTTE